MRMNAETMKLHGVVFSTAKQLLAGGLRANVELLALLSGYSEKQVKQAIVSLEKQGVVSGGEDEITELHGFHGSNA